jgi:hypothetical protein
LIIGAEACLVIIGWVFNIDALTRIFPNKINMKFPTALMFFFSAIALYLIFRMVKDNYELSSVLLPGIALSIFLIMGTILVANLTNTQTGLLANLTGTQTGIENLFVINEGSIFASGAGTPSMITILNFLLFGCACLNTLFDFSNKQRIFKFIGLFIAITSLISIIGYLFSLPVLYFEIYGLTPIALNTALSFLLLGIGLIIISEIKSTHET